MINKDTLLVMQKICRSCMREGSEMRSVFTTKNVEEGQTLQLAEMLMACTSIQIASGDGLPMQLCFTCETNLHSAFEFKRKCEKSDITLRELTNQTISKRSIKQESLDILIQPDIGNNISLGEFYNDEPDDSDSAESVNSKQTCKSNQSGAFTCNYCQKILRTKKGLKIHQRRHTGEKLRSCHLCQAKFTRTNHLRRHLETHNKSNDDLSLHICTECGATFAKAYHLVKHRKEHKLENFKVKKEDDCDNFEGGFVERELLSEGKTNTNNACNANEVKDCESGVDADVDFDQKENDKNVEKERKVMECEFCDRIFKYRKSFIHHMQTEHGMSDESDVPLSTYITKVEPVKFEITEKSVTAANCTDTKDYTNLENSDDGIDGSVIDEKFLLLDSRKFHDCHVCQAKFTRANHLTRHMTLHRAVLIHKCDRCDKAFATPEYLSKHTQEDHINKPYICTMCDRPFSRGEHLIRHLKIHDNIGQDENLRCSICDKTFSRSDHLARHTKIHLQHDKRHVCSECGKAFNRLDNLKTHQRIHTGLKDNSRLHLCIYCGKEFNNSSNMIVHMRRHTGERPYKCTICGKGFPRSHDLKCHERTHSGEKPYLCTLCGKSFNKSNKLLRHTRVHTGERPYVCNICGRAFTQSNDLALHMRRHTGSRPYACGVCSARFIQSGQLKAHRRSSGHWMETQPDLKGGHRVEPVTPIMNPAPIKFKTHGKTLLKLKEDVTEKKEPRILSQTVGIMGNINIQNDNPNHSQPIIIDSTKLLQQFHNAGFVGFTTVINATPQGTNGEDNMEIENCSISNLVKERTSTQVSKIDIIHDGVTFSTVTSAPPFTTSTENYNFQNFG